ASAVPPDSGQPDQHRARTNSSLTCRRDRPPPPFHFPPLVTPSSETSELRLLDDVRQRLSRASIEEQQQQQPPLPPPQPRPRQQQRQPPYRHRVADPAPFAQVAPDSDGYEEGIDPLVRSTHERLAGVSDRIRRYQQETSDYFNQSVLLGCSPTERGEAAAANGVDQHSFDDLAEHGDFKSRVGRGANRRYNGHSSASPVSAAVASAASPPSVRGGSEPRRCRCCTSSARPKPSTTSTLRSQPSAGGRRNHPSRRRQDWAPVSVRMRANAAAAFDEERRHLLRELREARAEASRAAELRHQLEAAHAALKEAAEGVAPRVRREHATALARERAESERLRARLTEARAETDKLRRRLAAAESERMFLRNRERGVGSHSLSGDWSEEQAPEQSRFSAGLDSVLGSDGRRSPTEALRQSLADLERRQLIDSLPQARDSMGGGGGGGGGAPAWDRDAQLAEIRTLEQRYDQLQLEKRRVETALNHVPSVGRPSTAGRVERLEKRLDSIDRELGSLRITLRQYHFQISSGFTHPAASSAMEPPGQAATIYGCCRKRHGSLDGESAAPATKLFLTERRPWPPISASCRGQADGRVRGRCSCRQQLATDEQQQQQLRLTVSSPEVARLIDLQASSAATASAAPTTAAASLLPTSSAAALPPAIAERVAAASRLLCEQPPPPPAPPGGNDCRQLVLWQPPPQLSTLPPAAAAEASKQEQQASFALQPELQLQTMEAEEAGAADAA
uniref:Centrosomal protein of 162 kDa n=1 Tax=Macrostomum lignano TaxID=282301 RepID=A0A1I8IWM1_9PLAT